MEFPVVGVFPAAVVRTHVVGDALLFTTDHPAGGKVAAAKPSVIGKAVPVPLSTTM